MKRARSRLRPISMLCCALTLVSGAAAAADATVAASYQLSSTAIRRTVEHFAVPPLKMVREDGTRVQLDRELGDGLPTVVDFIYTSCTTICPLSSQELSRLQRRLAADGKRVHLVSISIDPEEDTPGKLRSYAHHFDAGADWHYYTGSFETSKQAQLAFGVYRGDKMTHAPVTLLRTGPTGDWVRLDGFATADDLYAELHRMQPGP